MAEYGVTDKGFNIKRLDTIMEEIHTDLSADFGFDTRLTKPSFLDTLITTFSNQISELWETAQNNYYAKYPATATGLNLDNAVQYGGIRRAANKNTAYMLHCTGDDGTYVREEAIVATNTNPEVTIGVSNAPKSGTIISGEGTEPVVQTSVSNGSEVSGKVIVSAATIKRCGTKACGK